MKRRLRNESSKERNVQGAKRPKFVFRSCERLGNEKSSHRSVVPLPFFSVVPLPFFHSAAMVAVAGENGNAGNVFPYT